MQINITNLIDDGQCYQTVRELRWPEGVKCPSCQSTQVIKRGSLLLDSRVVEWPMAYTLTCVLLSSLKPLFFNGLKQELRFSGRVGA